MQPNDCTWGRFNSRSIQYMSAGEWGKLAALRFDMSVFLLKEKRFLDSFMLISEAFFYDMNGEPVPFIPDTHIKCAERIFSFLKYEPQQIEKTVVERLSKLHSPFNAYSPENVAKIVVLYASGKREQASTIFHAGVQDTHAWLEKSSEWLNDSVSKQDRQLRTVQTAEKKYKESGDLQQYIDFWEKIWANGGLLFGSSKWWFLLPDLYFKQKRFDDVITFCEIVKLRDESLEEKADKYIARAEERKAKAAAKKK